MMDMPRTETLQPSSTEPNGSGPSTLSTVSSPKTTLSPAPSASAESSTLVGNTTAIAEALERVLAPIVGELGYEIVFLEAQAHRQKSIRLFIDFAPPADPSADSHTPIGIEDCAKVARAVDQPLETYGVQPTATEENPNPAIVDMSKIDPTLKGWLATGFELEVSSPGIDRPLRRERDFSRFTGREVRLSTFRPLTADELRNADYASRNPKQKNFYGEMGGIGLGADAGTLLLKISPTMGSLKSGKTGGGGKNGKTTKSAPTPVAVDLVRIPLSLISKANLEPRFDLVAEDAGEAGAGRRAKEKK